MPERRRALAQRRKTVGLSQERLAEAVGVDRSTVVRWERAETQPQPWPRPKLAAVLRISVEELAELLPPRPANAVAADDIAAESRDDLDAVRWFRMADRQVGGAHLYGRLTGYLRHAVAPRMFGQTLDHDGGAGLRRCRQPDRDGRVDGTRCRARPAGQAAHRAGVEHGGGRA